MGQNKRFREACTTAAVLWITLTDCAMPVIWLWQTQRSSRLTRQTKAFSVWALQTRFSMRTSPL
jgi:hypothetical protein